MSRFQSRCWTRFRQRFILRWNLRGLRQGPSNRSDFSWQAQGWAQEVRISWRKGGGLWRGKNVKNVTSNKFSKLSLQQHKKKKTYSPKKSQQTTTYNLIHCSKS